MPTSQQQTVNGMANGQQVNGAPHRNGPMNGQYMDHSPNNGQAQYMNGTTSNYNQQQVEIKISYLFSFN